jgi:hypothetical protein
MEPLAVDLMLLRALLTPEIKITPGRAIMARVVSAGEPPGKGALSIAGGIIDAELPKQVKAGQDIRLVVREVTPQRVVLSLSGQHQTAPAAAPPPAAELPGGGIVTRIDPDDEDDHESARRARNPAAHTIALRYDAPTLGAVDLRLSLDPMSLKVAIELPNGRPFVLANGAADELRARLAEENDAHGGRDVHVTVTPRREPLDVYA